MFSMETQSQISYIEFFAKITLFFLCFPNYDNTCPIGKSTERLSFLLYATETVRTFQKSISGFPCISWIEKYWRTSTSVVWVHVINFISPFSSSLLYFMCYFLCSQWTCQWIKITKPFYKANQANFCSSMCNYPSNNPIKWQSAF